MNPPIVESRQQTIIAIIDAIDGRITPVTLSTETVTIDPETGIKSFTIVTGQVRTVDGRLASPDATSMCRQCNAIISKTAERSCGRCTVALCARCAGNPGLCRWHRRTDRITRFWAWLSTIT